MFAIQGRYTSCFKVIQSSLSIEKISFCTQYRGIFKEKRDQPDFVSEKLIAQARNQKFFRAAEFFWNQATLIRNHLQLKKRKATQGKIPVFLLETLKNCTLNEKFNPQKMTVIRVCFPKLGYFFPISEKGKGDLPSSPVQLRACSTIACRRNHPVIFPKFFPECTRCEINWSQNVGFIIIDAGTNFI